MSQQIKKTVIPLELGSLGERDVTFRYTFSPGMPEIISDHWGGCPADPDCVEIIGATFLGKDVLPLLTEEALDYITDFLLSLEGAPA